MLRICKDGKKKYQSLGISVLPRYWDFTRNKPKPNCPNKEYIQKIILDKQTELQQRMLEFNSEQKEYTTTTLLNDENKRFELKTVCQFYQEQIEQCKVLCKQKIRNSFLNPVFSIYTKYFIVPYFFIIANPPYLICSNEILSFLLELSHISVENENFIFISISVS